jgi:transcriptional repressor NrdR
MDCPFCGSSQVMVVNSRPNSAKSRIWRRRKCEKCGSSFTTYEKINLSYIVVVKKSGRKQKYSRAKLYSSIYHSCLDKKNVDRGEASQFSEMVTDTVEEAIFKLKNNQVSSGEILNMVLDALKVKSQDTLMRYLAYRKGDDKKELKKIVRKYFL